MKPLKRRRPLFTNPGTGRELEPESDVDVVNTEDPPALERSPKYYTTFLLLTSALIIYDLIAIPEEAVNFQAIKSDLFNNVYNQNQSVKLLIETLNKIENEEQSLNIISFVGSTGVGKTHMANILKKGFQPFVHELRGPLGYVSYDLIRKIESNSVKHKLVVVDDLSVSDIAKLLIFIKQIPEEAVTLVICIFNIQETDSLLNYSINYEHVKKISDDFVAADVVHTIARFNEFTKAEANDWVVKQLTGKGVAPHQHDQIIDSVLSNQNVKYHGLKGLNSKLNLEA